jgi:hypothetical protein
MLVRPAIVGLVIVVATLLIMAPLGGRAQPKGAIVHTVGVLAPHEHYRERGDAASSEALQFFGLRRR